FFRLQSGIPEPAASGFAPHQRGLRSDQFHVLGKPSMGQLHARFAPALLGALLLFSASPSAAADGDIAVVVHPGVPVSSLTFPEVRKLLFGDRQYWTPDLRVTLVMRAPVAREREIVLRTIYQMTEAQFRQYWISKIFRA